MARVWLEYGYTLPTPWLHLAITLGRACRKEKELETVASWKIVNRNQPEKRAEGKKRVRRGKEEGENFEPTIKTFQKSEPMFIASRTYVHWHMNLCSSSHELMFVLPRGFRASPLSPHRGHRPTISPSGKHPTDTNFIHF